MEDWLRSIGLANRVSAFVEAGITADQFGSLTEPDLRELGLTIGERKRFLKALASSPPGEPVLPEALPSGPSPRSDPPIAQGERRPLTVMFIDLVDSTTLGERLDAEDLMDLIRDYRAACAERIARYGGYIARFVGDGILAYFCYPLANENDPERAVRAAVDIVRAMDTFGPRAVAPLAVRIGLATGRVIVSDLFSGGETEIASVIGSTPNLAARLQSLAGANQIVISEQTYARVRRHFACAEMGSIELRGFDQPQRPWRILTDQPAPLPSAPTERSPRLSALRGREGEMAVLRAAWTRAAAGRGETVLIQGEPGIGKSRLVEEMLADLPPAARVIRLGALAFDMDSPLRPLVDHVRATAGLEAADTPPAARAKIAAMLLGDDAARAQALPIMAALAGVADADDPAVAALKPEQLRDRTIAVLIDQLLARAALQPVCLVIEDLHWLDPTSRQLLEAVLERIGESPILLLLTARNEFQAHWMAAPTTMRLRLERLSDGDVGVMLYDLFGERSVSPTLMRQILLKTDGVPLFVEEVARTLLDRQERAGADDELRAEGDAPIPDSLHASLMARLDRAGRAKELAQIAAVVGRSVRRDVLAAAYGAPAAALDAPLDHLVQIGVLERGAGHGVESYTFGHALLRDAAYDTLLREHRRSLHERVARALQSVDPAGVVRNPEVLALHLSEAGFAEEAAPHWMEAARRSLARSALTEARRILRRSLATLEAATVPTSANDLLRLRVSALLGTALTGLRGPNGAETREHYARALELCRRMPETPEQFPILWGWWRLEPASIARAAPLLDRAVNGTDPGLLLQAHHCNWCSHLNSGSLARCCEHVEAGLAIYAQGDYRDQRRTYGNHDPKVCAHGARAQAYWMQGRLRSALADEALALDWADRLDHVGSRVHAMGLTLLHRVYRRDHREVFDRARALTAFTTEHGIADHGAAGLIFQGWVVATRHDPAAGLRMLEDGLARQTETATNEDYSVYLSLLAEALIAANKPDLAVERLLRERPLIEATDLRIWMPEMLRMAGEASIAAGHAGIGAARALFAEASELARRQGAAMLNLRIAASDARCAGGSSDGPELIRQLHAELAAIPEPDDSYDLVDAQRLVGEFTR